MLLLDYTAPFFLYDFVVYVTALLLIQICEVLWQIYDELYSIGDEAITSISSSFIHSSMALQPFRWALASSSVP
jgi:hypothetical protein